MKAQHLLTFAALGAYAAGCPQKPEPGTRNAEPAPPGSALGSPHTPAPDALRVCELLQRAPARHKAACCDGASASAPFDECVRLLDRALAAQRLLIDRAAVERCESALSHALSSCDGVTPSQTLPPAECRSLVQGQAALGERCDSSLECLAPLHCQGATPSAPGQCAAAQPLGSGCTTTSDALASALFERELESQHPICQGRCSWMTRKCESASSESAPAPRPLAQPGAACRSDFDCARGGCRADGTCGMKCAVSLAPHAAALPALSLPVRGVRHH